jgi:DNA-binding MarR family transcriptional regulator
MVSAASTRPEGTSNASEHADTLALADRLRLSATRLARRLRQESDTDLTPSQLAALASVERHGPLTLGALAEVERVAPPSVTKVVNKLEAARLVQRTADDADRRVAWVAITPVGAKALARIRTRRSMWLATRLSALDARDRARLAAALDVLEELAGEAR